MIIEPWRSRDPEWRTFCIYSGNYLPDAALSDEHVIPKSLGGDSSTVVRASRTLNSRFAHEIDAKIAADPIIQFGRRDADARGHSRKPPMARWKGMRPWKEGPWHASDEHWNVDIPRGGPVTIYDTRRGRQVGSDILNDQALVTSLVIDSDARLKFCAKTLLGVGWRLFGPNFLSAVDTAALRALLGVTGAVWPAGYGLSYLDAFTAPSGEARAYVQGLERAMVRPEATSLLLREAPGELEWSVACVGHHVGTLVAPTQKSLTRDTLAPGAGILFLPSRGRLEQRIVDAGTLPVGTRTTSAEP